LVTEVPALAPVRQRVLSLPHWLQYLRAEESTRDNPTRNFQLPCQIA
jgi:hypothetical protein